MSPPAERESGLQVYLELTRLHQPVESLTTVVPYLIGAGLAVCFSDEPVELPKLAQYSVHLIILAMLSHFGGCAWNDTVDAKLDAQVARTRNRPIPRGAITRVGASMVAFSQLCAAAFISTRLTERAFHFQLIMIAGGLLYPFGKRVLPVPGLVLGMTVSCPILVGYHGLDISTHPLYQDRAEYILAALFVSFAAWMVVLDCIYGFQDLKDDEKVGIKSAAIFSRGFTKQFMASLTAVQVAGLFVVAYLWQGPGLFIWASGVLTMLLARKMIREIDLASGSSRQEWLERDGAAQQGIIIGCISLQYLFSGQ